MTCNCNRPRGNRFTHRVILGTAGTNFELITTNADNINDQDPYYFTANQCFLQNLPTTALPVTVGVNGTQVPVWNKYDAQILSSAIPKDAIGVYTEVGTPHVSLNDTPETITIA